MKNRIIRLSFMKKFCKTYLGLILLMPAFFFVISCSSEGSDNTGSVDYVEVAPVNEVYFESDSQNDTLLVRSNAEWMIVGENEWCRTAVLIGSECDTLVVYVTNNGSTEDREVALNLIAGTSSKQIFIKQYGGLETNYVDMSLEDPRVRTSYDSSTGDVSVEYTGNVPPVKAAKGQAIVLPAEYNYAIRVIESATVNGKTVSLRTSKGNMCHLFRNITFTLTTDPDAVTTLRRANKGRVVTPMEYGYYDSQGQYNKMWSAGPLKKDVIVSKEKQFWSFDKDLSGEKFHETEGGFSLSWEKYKCNASLQAVMSFEFGLGVDEISEELEVGEAESFGCELSGDFNIDMILKCEFDKEWQATQDTILKEDVIPVKVLKFAVGCVPVIVMLHTDLGAYADVEADAHASTSCGMNVNLKTQVGLQWSRGESEGDDSNNFDATVTSYPVTVNGKASLTAAVSLYTRLRLYLYESLGPRFDIAPYIQNKADSYFHYSSDNRAWLGWKSQTDLGVKTRTAVDWKFLWWEGDFWDTDLQDFKTWNMLTAPSKISSLNDELRRLELGEQTELVFKVTSYDRMGEEADVPCPGALVYFKGEYLDNEFAVADKDGIVRVKFNPQEGGNYGISARIVDSSESPDGFFDYSSDAMHEIYVYSEESDSEGGVIPLPGIGGGAVIKHTPSEH